MKTWIELMEEPATMVIWRLGSKDVREFRKLADAIAFKQESFREGTSYVESITASDGTTWE